MARGKNRRKKAAQAAPAGRSPHRLRIALAAVGVGVALVLWALRVGEADSPAPEARDEPRSATARSAPPPRNLAIFMIDTLRADALGATGYRRDTTPALDALAADGAVFLQAYSHSPWTRTSVASLFTGEFPASHGVQDIGDSLAPDSVTIAELLRDHGFETAAFITTAAMSPEFGVDQGFETYRYMQPSPDARTRNGRRRLTYVRAGEAAEELEPWLDSAGDRPFLLYVHTVDPHDPYDPPPSDRVWGEDLRARYDGEIRYTDRWIGRWLEMMDARGVLDSTLVVVLSDHGEEFGEHGGVGHGHTLYDELLRIPLLLRHPSIPPARIDTRVQVVDLLPTLLDALGVPSPEPLPGRSMWEELHGGRTETIAPRDVFAEVLFPAKIEGFAWLEGPWKLIHTLQDRGGKRDMLELYDLRDGVERRPRNVEAHDVLRRMREELRSRRHDHLARAVARPEVTMSPQTRDRLRALGYID